MSEMNMSELKEFVKMKREHPEEYNQFLEDLVSVIKDMKKVVEDSMR